MSQEKPDKMPYPRRDAKEESCLQMIWNTFRPKTPYLKKHAHDHKILQIPPPLKPLNVVTTYQWHIQRRKKKNFIIMQHEPSQFNLRLRMLNT